MKKYSLIPVLVATFVQPSFAQAEGLVGRLTQGLTERVEFDVNDFKLEGENPISQNETSSILSEFIGTNRGINDIENAADMLEKAIIESGYSFYQVSLPPQELTGGIITLKITRFELGQISVKGNNHYSEKNILSSLPLLQTGSSPSTKHISRALRVANQNSSKRVRVTLSPGLAAYQIDANVAVKDKKPWALSSWLNNTGTDSSGDYRIGVSMAHANLFDVDHSASLTYITSPEGISDVKQIAANYRIPLYKLGGSINFIAVNSDIDTGVVADVFDVAGRGEVYGVGYSHVLPSIGLYNQGWSAQIQDKLFDNDVTFEGRQLLEDVRSRPASLSYQASWGNGKGFEWSGVMSITSNLGGGSFNNSLAYNLARPGASDEWNKIDLGANYQYKASDWLYSVGLKISLSNDRLITGEQFSIGGAASVRGLEERNLRGDKGAQLIFQAWAPPLSKTLRPILFLDLGRVTNNDPLASEFKSEDVASLGVLLNWNPTNRISAFASYGYLIDGVDNNIEGEISPNDGDSKFHFNLTYRF